MFWGVDQHLGGCNSSPTGKLYTLAGARAVLPGEHRWEWMGLGPMQSASGAAAG